jgi:sulfur-oxidizing protein SoxX
MKKALFLLLGVSSLAFAEPTSQEVEAVLKRDFHARGQATMDRAVQDGLQRLCTESDNRPPAALAKTMEADQLKAIAFPEGSLIGDWKRGEKIAQGGRGLTWSDKAGAPSDGSCYNCHELSPAEMSHGTLGPSLRGFGKTRGNGAEMQRYVYGKIYNAKAYILCSQMPRLGTSGTLTPEQIKDLVGLLLDPASPVNR